MRTPSVVPTRALVAFVVASGCSVASAQEWTWRVSVDSSGVQGDNHSDAPFLSPDGRFVGFGSSASNLVAGDTNGKDDVFVHDRQTGITERISVDSAGTEGDQNSYGGAFSADSRFVAFFSYASNLVAGDTNRFGDAFLRDRQTGATERVSVDSSGAEGNGDSYPLSITADGRFVAFVSYGSNLVPGDTNGVSDVFVRDRQSGTTERVSVDSAGSEGTSHSYNPSISADGRFVVFYSWAKLVAGDKNTKSDIYVRDRQLLTTTRVSVDWTGSTGPNDNCYDPSISADGRFVAYYSLASNLVAGDGNDSADIFVHDLQIGTTERVSVDSSGVEGDADCFFPAISADGRYVAFNSFATNLVAGDINRVSDVFRHDCQTGTTERVSVNTQGGQAYQASMSYHHSISADGRFVAFESVDPSLVPGDTNVMWDAFVHGPFLTLDADPEIVGAGATLTLTTRMGLTFGAAVLAVTDIDGTPTFLPAFFGSFDSAGEWVIATTVPSGLSGHVLTLTSYGLVTPTSVKRSNDESVTLQ